MEEVGGVTGGSGDGTESGGGWGVGGGDGGGSCTFGYYDGQGVVAQGYGSPGGKITIQNYTGVAVTGLTSSGYPLDAHGLLANGGMSGDMSITNIAGRITLVGGVDLGSTIVSRRGDLRLQNSGGAISLGSLDLTKCGTARLDFQMSCVVTGAVANFATNYTGGAGQPLTLKRAVQMLRS